MEKLQNLFIAAERRRMNVTLSREAGLWVFNLYTAGTLLHTIKHRLMDEAVECMMRRVKVNN